ncbi:MAG: histidine kinase dimerization/phosphoacceptor domain -containing protein [Alkalispirochaeta sp.]
MSPDRVSDVLRPLRKDLLYRVLRVGWILALPALITGVYAAVQAKDHFILVVDAVAYALLITAYLLVRTRYRAAAYLFSGLTLSLGIIFVFTLGTLGASSVWLAAGVINTVLFLKRRDAFIAFSLAVGSLVASTILLYYEMLPWSIPIHGWIAVTGSFTGILFFLVLVINNLLTRLAKGVITEQLLAREVQHRVRNNLQLVQSILSIESNSARQEETVQIVGSMIDRVSAISHSFANLGRNQDTLSVDTVGLFDSLAVEQQRRGRPPIAVKIGTAPVAIPLDIAAPLAIVTSELLGIFTAPGAVLELALETSPGASPGEQVLTVTVSDRGVRRGTLPRELNEIRRSILDALVEQVHGTLEIPPDGVHENSSSPGSARRLATVAVDLTTE